MVKSTGLYMIIVYMVLCFKMAWGRILKARNYSKTNGNK